MDQGLTAKQSGPDFYSMDEGFPPFRPARTRQAGAMIAAAGHVFNVNRPVCLTAIMPKIDVELPRRGVYTEVAEIPFKETLNKAIRLQTMHKPSNYRAALAPSGTPEGRAKRELTPPQAETEGDRRRV